MTVDRAADGLAIRTEVLGQAYVDAANAAVTDYRRPLLDLVTEYGWGSVWSRPGLDRSTRSLLTIAAMTALRQQGELRVHVLGALRQGITPGQIQETLLQLAVYCGAPTAAEAFATVESALAEFGPSVPTPDSRGIGTAVRDKLVLLFATPDGQPRPQLTSALAVEAARCAADLPAPLSVASGGGIDARDAARATTALGAGRPGFGAPGYQGMLWVTGPAGSTDALCAAVDGVGTRLGSLVDLASSAAVAGTEETFLPGDGPLVGLYSIRRRDGLSYERFHDFWRFEHTKLSMDIPGFRYRQLHAAHYVSERAATSAGVGVWDIDGVVEYFFDDISYQVRLAELDNFDRIYEDEKNFINHSGSAFTYVELGS